MIDHLPPSLRGLMVAAFAAAFMSTIGTQLNWGASYLVNDFYRRFLKPTAAKTLRAHLAVGHRVARRPSAAVTFYMDSITGAWKLLIVTGAGTGGAAAALVLVAHQRLERGFGDDRRLVVRWPQAGWKLT
jgi:Na+/proline symporter